MRGSSGESVSRLGLFGGGVDALLAGSDSAAYHARQYQSGRAASDALSFASAAFVVLGLWHTEDFTEESPLFYVGAAVELIALPFWVSARRHLNRSVWWYNRDLPRP